MGVLAVPTGGAGGGRRSRRRRREDHLQLLGSPAAVPPGDRCTPRAPPWTCSTLYFYHVRPHHAGHARGSGRSSRPRATSRSGSRRRSRSSIRGRSRLTSASRSCAPPRRRTRCWPRPWRGADQVRDRDPLGARGETFADAVAKQREARSAVRAGGAPRRRAGRHRHAPVEPLAGAGDHRHRALPRGDWRSSTWPGGTTRSACTCTRGRERGRAGDRVCDRLRAVCRAARDLGQLAFLDGRHSGLHSARA